jgi:hypothetical protein
MAFAEHRPSAVPGRAWLSPALRDRLLLSGADPATSPSLRRRARALAGRRRRQCLANGLERAVAEVCAPPAPFSAAVPVQREEVLAIRGLMLELASRIRETDGRHPAGLILARRLLTSGEGPLFAPSAPGALRDAVTDALIGLRDVGPHSA